MSNNKFLTNADMVPMSVFQHLLVKLASESTELAHAVLKGVEFGVDHTYPGTEITILQKIEEEYNDLLGVVVKLKERGFPINIREDLLEAKNVKVDKFMDVARVQSVLRPESEEPQITFERGHNIPYDYRYNGWDDVAPLTSLLMFEIKPDIVTTNQLPSYKPNRRNNEEDDIIDFSDDPKPVVALESVYPFYYVDSNRCDCHPETCNCDDYAIYIKNSPNARTTKTKHSTHFTQKVAEEIAKSLNQSSQISKE